MSAFWRGFSTGTVQAYRVVSLPAVVAVLVTGQNPIPTIIGAGMLLGGWFIAMSITLKEDTQ